MKSRVQVGVRVRPPLARELEESSEGKSFNNCVAVQDETKIYVSLENKPVILTDQDHLPENVSCFTFDKCFPPNST